MNKKTKFKGNIYYFSQVNFAYNSNKIEEGKLTEDETVLQQIHLFLKVGPNKIDLINVVDTS